MSFARAPGSTNAHHLNDFLGHFSYSVVLFRPPKELFKGIIQGNSDFVRARGQVISQRPYGGTVKSGLIGIVVHRSHHGPFSQRIRRGPAQDELLRRFPEETNNILVFGDLRLAAAKVTMAAPSREGHQALELICGEVGVGKNGGRGGAQLAED